LQSSNKQNYSWFSFGYAITDDVCSNTFSKRLASRVNQHHFEWSSNNKSNSILILSINWHKVK